MGYWDPILQAIPEDPAREAEVNTPPDYNNDSGAGGDTGSVATSNLDGNDIGGLLGGFFGPSQPTDARWSYNAPAGAWSVGTGTGGNPQYQLKDEAGNIVQWAIDALGNMVDVRNLGPAGQGGVVSQDFRDTYAAPAGASKVGETGGNPLYQLVDSAGSLIQWGINRAGEIIGLTNLGEAKKAPPVVSTPPPQNTGIGSGTTGGTKTTAPGAGNINTGNSVLDGLINGANRTNNPDGGAGLGISNTTYAPINTTTNVSTVTTTSTVANSAGQFNDVLKQITDIFKPTNDAALTRGALNPSMFSGGRAVDYSRSQQGSNTDPAAIVKGNFLTTNQNDTSKYMWILVAVSVLTFAVLLFRRK